MCFDKNDKDFAKKHEFYHFFKALVDNSLFPEWSDHSRQKQNFEKVHEGHYRQGAQIQNGIVRIIAEHLRLVRKQYDICLFVLKMEGVAKSLVQLFNRFNNIKHDKGHNGFVECHNWSWPSH